MAVQLLFLALVVSSYLTSCLSAQSEVTVSPNCSNVTTPCVELDGAFQNLTSNTTLHLKPGQHVLHRYQGWHLVGLHDVSIIGMDGREPVMIKCDDGIGMTFINITHLTISNIVIDGCGLSNDSLRNASSIIEMFLLLDLNFIIPCSMRIGIFLAHCTDLSISDSVITNTIGLGMIGVNMIGNSGLKNVNFTHNVRPKCEKELKSFPFYLQQDKFSSDQIGGGAYFLYQDFHEHEVIRNSTLHFTQCNFVHNAECSYAGYVNVNYKYFSGSSDFKYSIGGGGGLSIFMPQLTFAVNVSVSNSTFNSNDARYGAGAHIGFFAGSNVSTVQFSSCTFDNNGYPVQQEFNVANGGAGVAVFMDLLRRTDSEKSHLLKCDDCNSIHFTDTNFTRNFALTEGGGVFAYSLSKSQQVKSKPFDFRASINFTRCHFLDNTAKYGAGLCVSQRATHGVEGTWGVNFKDVKIEENQPPHIPTDVGKVASSTIGGKCSAVELESVIVSITEGSLIIRGNKASGLHLTSSIVYLSDSTSLILQENRARHGGGAYMDGNIPIIITSANSKVIFRDNVATAQGGGLFYESQFSETGTLKPLDTVDCFVSSVTALFGKFDEHGLFDSNITIEFTNNEAPIGSIVFGSTLNSCSWAKSFNVSDKDLFLELHNNQRSTFIFSEIPCGVRAVSTQPYFISVPQDDKSISSCPGQTNYLSLSVEDVFMNKIEATLRSETIDESDNDHSVKLGSSGSWYHRVNEKTVPFHVEGVCGNNITVSLYTASNLISTDISVNILPCFVGFVYSNKTKECSCDPLVERLRKPSMCDDEQVTLTVPPFVWLGCDPSECSSTSDLIFLECYFSFCNPKERVFNTSDPSSLCAENSHRSGIMCGECAEGYSIVFGADICHNCTSANPAVILSMSLMGGLASFLFISLLGITIDKGWTYMVIFFCNVIFPYSIYEIEGTALLRYMFIPAHFFAQEIIVTRCFYDGLDSLAKSGFQLLYCAYLYILMGLFTILCRCSSYVSKYFFPPKTLATLIFLTYNLIFKTCADVLSAVTVNNVAGTNESLRWLVDPNVPYFQNWHAALGGISIILVVIYIIPFPLLLLSPSLAYKYGQRFKPFLDAIWAPFKPKYRIWASLRIAVRVLVIMFSRFLVVPSLAGIIANLSILATFLYAQSIVQPFNDKLINITDNLLTLIILFMHFGACMKLSQQINADKLSFGEIFYVVFLIILAYFVLLATFLWYNRNTLRKLLKLFSYCCTKRRGTGYHPFDTPAQQSIQNRPTHTSVSIVPEPNWLPRRRNFTRIRETLLEDHESMHFVAN